MANFIFATFRLLFFMSLGGNIGKHKASSHSESNLGLQVSATEASSTTHVVHREECEVVVQLSQPSGTTMVARARGSGFDS